jgi:hypothetical protein
MKNSIRQGRLYAPEVDYDPQLPCRPNPIVTFAPVWTESKLWYPKISDRSAILLLRRQMDNKVSFVRAYRGWRASGSREERELGEGRAFFRWLQKHQISIDWKEEDFRPHPYFTHPNSPTHDPNDEMSKEMSFCVRPVQVQGRNVKLYIQDTDMVSLLNMPYGNEEDFLELVMRYVAFRFQLESWRAPAPYFLNWVTNQGVRPIFSPGQVGFRALY